MKTVFIDAGHGGKDPGACGNGLKEKDVVFAVSLAIKKQLELEYEDIKVILARSTDVFLELKERTDAANKLKPDLLVSIHCNAGGGAGGFETFRYTDASKSSTAFQNVLHSEIMNALKPFGVIDRGQKAKNLHMVRESDMTSVLTENLFVDVLGDANKLKRADLIQAIVSGHVTGIVKFLGLQKKVVPNTSSNTVKVIADGVEVTGGILINGTTYVPLRAAGEALGAKVEWDGKTKTATITK